MNNVSEFIYLLILKIKRLHFVASICLWSIVVFSCSRPSGTEREETVLLTKFFEELLLEHGGAYTLLGSKPATIEDLIDTSPESYKKLQEYLAAHPEIPTIEVDRYLEEGWDILKKDPVPLSDKFVLTEVNCGTYNLLVFLNSELTVPLMKEHLCEFKRVAGDDFDPLTKADCYLNDIAFRIPKFIMFDKKESEKLVREYRREREKIKVFYSKKNFLDTTLTQINN